MKEIATVAGLVGLVSVLGAVAVPLSAQAAAPTEMSYIALPHPDDEWQTWALVENSPANYKVFVLMTKGEQSGYCDTPYASTVGPSSPTPTGKWTDSCEQARTNSWVKFFTKMGATDSTLPSDLEYKGKPVTLPANGASLTRVDDGSPYSASRAPDVWVDRQGRGALVSFDLGDGDLTQAEVTWAIKSVVGNRSALKLNSTLPNYNLIGAYSNKYYSGCATYDHPDHYAIHAALYNTDFGMNYQTAATCSSDTDTSRVQSVSASSVSAAWGSGNSFEESYGWLGDYAYSSGESTLFHGKQAFWTRRW